MYCKGSDASASGRSVAVGGGEGGSASGRSVTVGGNRHSGGVCPSVASRVVVGDVSGHRRQTQRTRWGKKREKRWTER